MSESVSANENESDPFPYPRPTVKCSFKGLNKFAVNVLASRQAQRRKQSVLSCGRGRSGIAAVTEIVQKST